MSAYESDFYLYVKFTFKAKDYSGGTKTVYVGNRPAYDETSINIIPGLISVRGLSSGVSGNLPSTGAGQIAIDNTRGLFGTNLRFSDYFDKYTLAFTEVEIYTNFNTASDSSTVSSGATKLWVDKVLKASVKNNKVNIFLRTDIIPEHTLTAVVDTTTFPNAIDSAIGKAVPLVMGDDIQVKPLRHEDDGLNFGSTYLYATTLADDFVNGGINKIYAKNKDGGYYRVSSSTTAYTSAEFGHEPNSGTAADYTNNNQAGMALQFTTDSTTGVVCVGIRVYLYKRTTPPTDEIITGGIWTNSVQGNRPAELIAQTSEILSDDLASGWNDTKAQFSSEGLIFETPVVLAPNTTYWFGIWSNYRDDSTTPTRRIQYNFGSSGSVKSFYIIDAGTSTGEGYWAAAGNTANNLDMGLYVVHLNTGGTTTDYPSPTASFINSDNLGFSRFVTTSYLKHYTDRVDYVFSVDGLEDDGSGTLTGVANRTFSFLYDSPKILDTKWNGSAWVAGDYQLSPYGNSHTGLNINTNANYRIVRGATRGKATAKSIMQKIAEEHLGYIARVKGDSQYAMWTYGNEETVAGRITDIDVIGDLEFEVHDRTTTTSHVRASYHKKLTSTRLEDVIVQGADSTFNNYIEDTNTGASGLFGEVESKRKTYNWLYDTTSAGNLARMILELGGLPSETIKFSVPYQKFSDLVMFDVFEITHTDLPFELGTDPDPRATNADVDTDITGNSQWVTAKPYRAQIWAINYEFENKVPTMKITARLLINPSEIT